MRDWRRRLHENLRTHESERLMSMARAVVLQDPLDGRLWTVSDGETSHVGRHKQAEIRFDDRGVSRKHCALTFSGDTLSVTNLSPKGTCLNASKLEGPAAAQAGDLLRFGKERELYVSGILDPSAPRRSEGRPTVPQRVAPRFLLVRPVGRGAAGTVYEAWDESAKKRVAIKVLTAGGWATEELTERFRREVTLQGRLRDYPGIVSMYEMGTLPEGGELFAVMEFVAGKTLSWRLRELSLIDGVRVLARVARAAQFAHANGLVHRDLKPANVMLCEDDSVRLTDLGLCKTLEGPEGLTVTGTTLGTPLYMAPEQVNDAKRVGTAADVWALGVMLYQHVTKRLPFASDNVGKVIDMVSQGVFTPPIEVDRSIPIELNALCLRAMNFDPDGRPPASTIAKDLEAWARRIDTPSRVSLIPPDLQFGRG